MMRRYRPKHVKPFIDKEKALKTFGGCVLAWLIMLALILAWHFS